MRWPLDKFEITQAYSQAHPALDLGGNPVGTPILSPESGVVVAVNNDPRAYFGGLYVVVGGDSGYRYYLGHNSRNYVSPGQRVSEGQHIADIGQSGFAVPDKGISAPSGPHTHFEVSRNGSTLDFRTLKELPAQEDEDMQPAPYEVANIYAQTILLRDMPRAEWEKYHKGKTRNQLFDEFRIARERGKNLQNLIDVGTKKSREELKDLLQLANDQIKEISKLKGA